MTKMLYTVFYFGADKGPSMRHIAGHLLHRQYSPEPGFPTQHMIQSLLRILEREFLNHAIDIVDLRKVDGFLAIEACA